MVKYLIFLFITTGVLSCKSLYPRPKTYPENGVSLKSVLAIELREKCENFQVDLSQFKFNTVNINDAIVEDYFKISRGDSILFSHYVSPRGSMIYIQNSKINDVLLLSSDDSIESTKIVGVRNSFIYRAKENICNSSDDMNEPYLIQTMIYNKDGELFFLNNWTDNFAFFQF